jgi:16S rRNA (cytosine1402-N4)-methyltransferase
MTPRRSTPAGQHVPVLLNDVLAILDPQPGEIVFDGTIGWAGHATALLRLVGQTGKLIGTDFDPLNITKAREHISQLGLPFSLHHGNYAGVQQVLGAEGIESVDMLLVDLGMSSMQVDDPERGFSYVREGPLDMRMDPTRGTTAADLLARLSERELTQALAEIGDEPNAGIIAHAIVAARQVEPITRTTQLSRVIAEATGQTLNGRLRPGQQKWKTHPAARTFQVLRILVNRELANLDHLLRVLPAVLKPGGRAAIISFHSGEDRRVKHAFKTGLQQGVYEAIADDPIRPKFDEQRANPRSRSAKLRWARRA